MTIDERADHQRRHDILRPILMTESQRLELNRIVLDYISHDEDAEPHSAVGYAEDLRNGRLLDANLSCGGPYSADGKDFDTLQDLVEAFACAVRHLHGPGIICIIIVPADNRVDLIREVRVHRFVERKEDV